MAPVELDDPPGKARVGVVLARLATAVSVIGTALHREAPSHVALTLGQRGRGRDSVVSHSRRRVALALLLLLRLRKAMTEQQRVAFGGVNASVATPDVFQFSRPS